MRNFLLLFVGVLFLTLSPFSLEASASKSEPAAEARVSELQHILLDLNRGFDFSKVRRELVKLEHSMLKEQIGDLLVLVSSVPAEEADLKTIKAEILRMYPDATVKPLSLQELEELRWKHRNDPR